MSTPNPPVKHSVDFINKRKMLTFIPVLGAPFLTAMFWLGGGGTAVAPVAAATGTTGTGINMSLPAAQPAPLFDSKADAYRAPIDTSKNRGLAFSTVGAMSDAESEDTPSSPTATGLNYGVNAGETKLGFDAQNADPNVVAVQSRLQRLQQTQNGTGLPASYGPPPGAYGAPAGAYGASAGAYGASGGYGSPAAAYGGYSGGGYAASPPRSARDQELELAMKDLDRLKAEYEKRIADASKPAAPAAPVAAAPEATTAVAGKAGGATVVSSAPTSVITTLAAPKGKVVALATPAQHSNSFHSLGTSDASADVNAVPATVHSDQTVTAGSTVKLRLLQDVAIEGRLIPRNSFIYGLCTVSGQRLGIEISSVQYQNSIIPVKLSAFDLDGGEGLYIPGSLNRDAAKQGVSQGVTSADMLTMSPNAGAQVAGVAMQTGKALLGNQVKLIKVNLKANYKILLK